MIWGIYFLLFFFCTRFIVALVNFLSFHFLPLKPQLETNPTVTVLIPARNEEKNIASILNQLTNSTYQPLDIIVYNDKSTDKTEEIAAKFADENNNIRVLKGTELPEGWLGKNYACYNLAKHAKSEFLLFLDADVEVKDGLIEGALDYMLNYKLKLLSIFPKQIISSFGEQISVPLMNWILLSFLPLVLIRKSSNPAFSAANGQFMMFDASTYKKHQPHSLFRAHKVEDIAISQYYKKNSLLTDTMLGNNLIRCKMYSGLNEAVSGFTKNIFQFFGNSVALTILVGLITTLTPFMVYLYFGLSYLLMYIMASVLLRVFVSLASKQSVFKNLIFQIPQHIVFLYIIYKGIRTITKRELIWKGRNILQV